MSLRAAAASLLIVVAASAAALAAPAPATDESSSLSDSLDALRQECITAAREAQQREQAIGALEHELDLRDHDLAARQRGLDESRPQQERLLGVLASLARHPPDRSAAPAAAPIDAIRGELLLQSAVPLLQAQAQALSDEFARITALHAEIAARTHDLAAAREALGAARGRVAELAARREELTGRLLPDDAAGSAPNTRLGHDAADLADLIERADAASDRRDKLRLAQARVARREARPGAKPATATPKDADPTRPGQLHEFDPRQSALVMPVSGRVSRPFGAADAAGTTRQGLDLAALPGAEVVAPFDGRVVYAGRFLRLGLVLIIRHGPLYHSLLAGLGRVDLMADRWVLAGEPVGAMPDAPPPDAAPPAGEVREGASAGPLYFELRRDGRTIDPRPWLARGEQDEEQKVRQ